MPFTWRLLAITASVCPTRPRMRDRQLLVKLALMREAKGKSTRNRYCEARKNEKRYKLNGYMDRINRYAIRSVLILLYK